MTKKITTFCCTVTMLATTAATPALSQSKNFAGPSIAIGAGYNTYQQPLKYEEGGDNFTIGGSKENFMGVVDVSYGFDLGTNSLVSFGANYNFNNSKADVFNVETGGGDTLKITAKLKDQYAIYAQPTYALSNNTAIFGKLSYNFAKASYTLTETGGSNGSATGSENIEGWGYGAGIKAFLDKNLYVQFEGNFVDYKKASSTETVDGSTYVISTEPKSLSALISVGYKF
jgi:opacity protein-like surface antigen